MTSVLLGKITIALMLQTVSLQIYSQCCRLVLFLQGTFLSGAELASHNHLFPENITTITTRNLSIVPIKSSVIVGNERNEKERHY